MKKETIELKLKPDETILLMNKLIDFYGKINTIQEYFIERKKEKVLNIDNKKYIKLMFDDYSINPRDMEFEIEIMDTNIFNNSIQIITSLPIEQQMGRQIMVGVKEKTTNKYVGFIRLASPLLRVVPRTELFNECFDPKSVNKFIISGAVLVPVQPFGYNYLGGKLLALIATSHELKEMLNKKYDGKVDIVFMETTSLYGDIKNVSQYDGLKPFMRYAGMTKSDLFLFPTMKVYIEIRDLLRFYYGKQEYGGALTNPKKTTPKMREFNKIISILKTHILIQFPEKYNSFCNFTKKYMKSKTKKRYYYSNYGYENYIEYIKSDGKIKLNKNENYNKHHLSYIIEWWKNKAQNRYNKLKEEDKLKSEIEVYDIEKLNNLDFDMIR